MKYGDNKIKQKLILLKSKPENHKTKFKSNSIKIKKLNNF